MSEFVGGDNENSGCFYFMLILGVIGVLGFIVVAGGGG